MGETIRIDGCSIQSSQIGGKSNIMVNNTDGAEWNELENIWIGVLKTTCKDKETKELAEEALSLTKKRDKKGLSDLVKKYFGEFTMKILTETTANMVLKFLL